MTGQFTDCACTAIRRAAQGATALYDRVLAPSGLRATQFSLLRNIHRLAPVNITDLALAMHLDRTTLGRNVRLLERAHLVKLAMGKHDQRERTLQLTGKGEAVLTLAIPLWEEAQRRVEARFPERKKLFRVLQALEELNEE